MFSVRLRAMRRPPRFGRTRPYSASLSVCRDCRERHWRQTSPHASEAAETLMNVRRVGFVQRKLRRVSNLRRERAEWIARGVPQGRRERKYASVRFYRRVCVSLRAVRIRQEKESLKSEIRSVKVVKTLRRLRLRNSRLQTTALSTASAACGGASRSPAGMRLRGRARFGQTTRGRRTGRRSGGCSGRSRWG